MNLESSDPSKVTAPPEEGAPALLEEMANVVVTTSALAVPITAGAGKMEAVESQEASGQVVCGPRARPPSASRGLGPATVLCWASLGSCKTRETVCTLLAACLQLSTLAPGG